MNEIDEKIECPICKEIIHVKPSKVIDNVRVIRCYNCCVDFVYPMPRDVDIKNLYSKQYYLNMGSVGNLHCLKSKTFNDYMKVISSYKQKGKLLDIGTAYGFFVEKALEFNFDAYGVDISEYAISIAKQNISKDRFFVESIVDTHFKTESFDIITLIDVLEHLNNPLKILTKITSLLKKDGILFITTPDANSLGAHIQNINMKKYHLEHIYRYKEKSLNILFTNAGFNVLNTKQIWKTVNISCFNSHFNTFKLFPITQIFNLLNKLKFINEIPFKMRIGNVMYLLKKCD